MKPSVFMQPIRSSLCRRTIRLLRKRIINDPASKYGEGKHTLPINAKTELLHFEDYFERESPYIFQSEKLNKALLGFTHTGFAIKIGKKANIIPPNHCYTILVPGSPPTEHQFVGTGPLEGEGTSLIAYFLENHMRIPDEFYKPELIFKKW